MRPSPFPPAGAHMVNCVRSLLSLHLVWFKVKLPGWRTEDGTEKQACLFFLAPRLSRLASSAENSSLSGSTPGSRLRFCPENTGCAADRHRAFAPEIQTLLIINEAPQPCSSPEGPCGETRAACGRGGPGADADISGGTSGRVPTWHVSPPRAPQSFSPLLLLRRNSPKGGQGLKGHPVLRPSSSRSISGEGVQLAQSMGVPML